MQQQLNLDQPSEAGPGSSPIPTEFARDEMNLAEFPLAVLSTRSNPKIKTLEFKDSQRLKNGEVIEREWIITGADKFGLPTSTDDDVLLGLMRLSMDEGFRSEKVYFTRYELLRILRWTTEGRSYSRLTKSLDRLSGVRIRATNAFYDNKSKSYQTCNFGIIDAYEIHDSRGTRRGAEEQPKSFFTWSDMLFDSFKAGFIKKLDLEVYFKLRSAVSRRLYRYLDKHFYYKPYVELPLRVLAFEKLGLSRSYKYDSSIKQQLQPAVEELQEIGFLQGVEYDSRRGQTSIRLRSTNGFKQPVQRIQSEEPKSVPEKASPIESDAQHAMLQTHVESQLVKRGLSATQMPTLLRGKTKADLEKIRAIVSYYDHLCQTNDRRIARNPIGFLYRAVEHPFRFKIPKQFKAGPARADSTPGRHAAASNGGEDKKESYRDYAAYRREQASVTKSGLSKPELRAIYEMLESKMRPMKDNLPPERFEEALDGCVQDELAKRAGVPNFDAWVAGKKKAAN